MTFAPGAMTSPTFAGIAVAILWRAGSIHAGGLFRVNNAGGGELFSSNPYLDGKLYVAYQGGGFVAAKSYSAGEWYLDIFVHGPSVGAARVHTYNFTTSAWTHADAPNPSQNPPTSGGNYPAAEILVGRYNGTSEDTDGDIGALAFWTGGTFIGLSDAAIEATGMHAALSAWLTQSPAVCWPFNQASTATPVPDLSSSGTATQTSITGTTIGTDPPGFSYSLGITLALPTAVETSNALGLGRAKRRTLPLALETGSALPLVGAKRRTLPTAAELAAALPLGRVKSRPLPLAAETSTARPVAAAKRRALPLALELDTAVPLAGAAVIRPGGRLTAAGRARGALTAGGRPAGTLEAS
ncbi:hypothetical protein ACFFSQ_46910 [Dactylosporangium matsuzakiense]|uniref:hypothetical protein n=1 Tax=Dactylosporangium matsuzakiense TaxID=53360 RepID=UPI0031E85329